MIIKTLNSSLFILIIINLFSGCIKNDSEKSYMEDDLEKLRNSFVGNYEYIKCTTSPNHINDTGSLHISTICDSSKKILSVKKSTSENVIEINKDGKTLKYILSSDSTFYVDVNDENHSSSGGSGKFYKKDSIYIYNKLSPSWLDEYYGKKNRNILKAVLKLII